MAESELIASLYLPVEGYKLLLPNVSVAEVVEYIQPECESDMPEYYLGKVTWRGIQLPLLSYELANGQARPGKNGSERIAVINTIGKNHKRLPFFALLTQGIPRLVKVSAELVENNDHKAGQVDLRAVRLDGEEAVIPDIISLEKLAVAFV
jgi:chemosensory pili system protein ChpC